MVHCGTIVVHYLSCRQVELLRRKERNEAHLFMSVEVYTEDDFQSHQGSDLLEFEDVKEKCVGTTCAY